MAVLGGGCRSVDITPNQAELHATPNQGIENRSPSTGERSSELGALVSLSDYLQYAALHNPSLEAAFNQWKAALERMPQVRALPDPKFFYGNYIRAVETRAGPQNQKFGIAQSFPWFGKLSLRGDKAGAAANAARERYEAQKLKLYYQVKQLYFEYYYLRRTIDTTEENIELLKGLEGVAQTKFRAGSDVGGVV